MMQGHLPSRLQEIIADFDYCQGREKLEHLLELAQELRPLPGWLMEKRHLMEQVQGCVSPVFVFAELNDGRLTYHIDAPVEAPSVRGYASALQQGLGEITPAEMKGIPIDLFRQMGLDEVLSQQRQNGFTALVAHMKEIAERPNERS